MAKGRSKSNKPKIAATPSPTKTPRIGSPPPSFKGGVMAWRFAGIDKNGPFAWTNLDDPKLHKEIIDKLRDFENMDEAALLRAGCHSISTENLSADAINRLVEIQLDDLDMLYSMHVCSTVRIFCVHRPNYMRILWFDPEHQVCPSHKKHT